MCKLIRFGANTWAIFLWKNLKSKEKRKGQKQRRNGKSCKVIEIVAKPLRKQRITITELYLYIVYVYTNTQPFAYFQNEYIYLYIKKGKKTNRKPYINIFFSHTIFIHSFRYEKLCKVQVSLDRTNRTPNANVCATRNGNTEIKAKIEKNNVKKKKNACGL